MNSRKGSFVTACLLAFAAGACAENPRPTTSLVPAADVLTPPILDERCIPKIAVGIEGKYETDCRLMTKPQKWRGTWRIEFEGSTFTPDGQEHCYKSEKVGDCIWLEGKVLPWPGRWACAREFEIEFIGRKNVWPGSYGHGGSSYYKIVVDRLISTKRLPDPEHDPSQCDAASP